MGRAAAAAPRTLTLRRLLVASGLVALLVRLPYLVGPLDGRDSSDSGIYLGMVADLFHGRGFAHATEFRTPGYALLLAPLHVLPGRLDEASVIVQHLVGVAFTVAIVWAAWRWFGRGAAVGTAVLASFSPVLVSLEGDVLPDLALGVAATVGAFLLARALEGETIGDRWVAAAGVAFGVAALIKPVGQVFLLMALVPLLVEPRRVRAGVRAGALLAGCLVLTITPWLVRNAVKHGDVRMSTQDGPNLWLREFDYDKRPFPSSTAQGRLAELLYNRDGGREPGITGTYQSVVGDLVHNYGYSVREATDFQRAVALQAIREAPWAYARGTAKIFLRLGWIVHSLRETQLSLDEKTHHTPTRLSTAASAAAFRFEQLALRAWLILSVGFVSVVFLLFRGTRRLRAAAWSLAVCWSALSLGTAIAGYPDARYAAQVMPLQWILGSAGAAVVVDLVRRRVASIRQDHRV